MDKKAKLLVAGLAASGLIGIAAGVGVAANSNDDDRPLKGTNYERATSAALAHVGGGPVTNTEIGDDGEAYEVDIRRDDGTQVEAELDSNFNVTRTEAEDADEGADVEEDGDDERADDEGPDDD